jgi:hypothetical protein
MSVFTISHDHTRYPDRWIISPENLQKIHNLSVLGLKVTIVLGVGGPLVGTIAQYAAKIHLAGHDYQVELYVQEESSRKITSIYWQNVETISSLIEPIQVPNSEVSKIKALVSKFLRCPEERMYTADLFDRAQGNFDTYLQVLDFSSQITMQSRLISEHLRRKNIEGAQVGYQKLKEIEKGTWSIGMDFDYSFAILGLVAAGIITEDEEYIRRKGIEIAYEVTEPDHLKLYCNAETRGWTVAQMEEALKLRYHPKVQALFRKHDLPDTIQ